MSYEIFYKTKVFNDQKCNIFVFALHGSNNDFFVTWRGTQISSRDWYLFFRGPETEFKEYCLKVFSEDYINLSRNTSISPIEFCNKVLNQRRDNIINLKNYFHKAEIGVYEGVKRELQIQDLYTLEKEHYFYKNANKEYPYFVDNTLQNILNKVEI